MRRMERPRLVERRRSCRTLRCPGQRPRRRVQRPVERPGPRLFPGAGAFRRTERLRGAGVLELTIHWRDGRKCAASTSAAQPCLKRSWISSADPGVTGMQYRDFAPAGTKSPLSLIFSRGIHCRKALRNASQATETARRAGADSANAFSIMKSWIVPLQRNAVTSTPASINF